MSLGSIHSGYLGREGVRVQGSRGFVFVRAVKADKGATTFLSSIKSKDMAAFLKVLPSKVFHMDKKHVLIDV